MRSTTVRLLASSATAIGLTLVLYGVRASGLDVRTDIVGYPTFANFDIRTGAPLADGRFTSDVAQDVDRIRRIR